ncbi:unnamed protein product [Darwinula stevensoni]|uniref:Uncharacterized protein n=1 Tax=Darwinula stevensoni TaxID=69355 RepID=A0A7R8XER1_9CRUS|nr:unnamed protein product [Darwinula stevensoni]CAG0894473.1 unnamed protein product [Darwinula stevensoni]
MSETPRRVPIFTVTFVAEGRVGCVRRRAPFHETPCESPVSPLRRTQMKWLMVLLLGVVALMAVQAAPDSDPSPEEPAATPEANNEANEAPETSPEGAHPEDGHDHDHQKSGAAMPPVLPLALALAAVSWRML